MMVFSSITRIVFICIFYCASLCLLKLSWAEDITKSGNDKQDNFTNENFSEELIVSVNSVITNSGITNSAVVQSSFEEVPSENASPFSQSEFAFVDTASQNSGVFNDVTDTGQGVVFTLADTATAELQQRADIPSAITSHNNETPNLAAENATDQKNLHVVVVESQEKPEPNDNKANDTQQTDNLQIAVEQEEVPTLKAKENATNEDIPSFSEWAQKQLEEAEKKKELVNTSSQTVNVNGKSNSNVKLRSKNYASPDCGAKIVAANPEAVSANALLSPSRDEYKLNACTNRIWFVVELCEAIQAKKIDLANFELFSSSPKDFTVSVSDRFPTRDWLNVGQFTAKDERDVQSFDLNPQLFGKFIKVELLSHHGSEHFCPISLFRVYGTSEFEVLEKEDEGHGNLAEDEDDDEAMDTGNNGDSPKNLFSSATDAVISIVKKAAEVLGNKANNSNQTNDEPIKSTKLKDICTTPSHLVVCDNCSDVMFTEVYDLISCRSTQLYKLINLKLIRNALYKSDTCKEFGLDFRKRKPTSRVSIYSAYVKSIFSPTYLASLCNALAVIEHKVVLNISKQFPNITKEAPSSFREPFDPPNYAPLNTTQQLHQQSDGIENLTLEASETVVEDVVNIVNKSEAIKPTKTLPQGNVGDLTISSPPENKDEVVSESRTSPQETANATTPEVAVDMELGFENLTEYEVTTESSENLDFDLISELNNLGSPSAPNTAASVSSTAPQVKESVFLRLSNRIKALERNMSLSSQYLEELSRRYKKQVEEMQRLMDKTVKSLNEESRKRDEHNRRLEQQLIELSAIVNTLVIEKNVWITITHWLFLAVLIFFGFFTICRRLESKRAKSDYDNSASVAVQRRKSIAVVRHETPQKKQRRPSEEALKISGTYTDLMIDDVDNSKKKYKERKKRKKKQLQRSNSISQLSEKDGENDMATRNTRSDHILCSRHEWEVNNLVKNRLEDIPIALEESDNHPLQSLPIPPTLQSVKTNGSIILKSAPSFMKTLKETRGKPSRNGSVQVNGYELDVTRQRSPTPSSGATSLDEAKSIKKEKKGGGIKRILRKVF